MQNVAVSPMPRVVAQPGRLGGPVLGAFIDALEWDDAVSRLVEWGARRESRYVCIVNVHSVVTGSQDAAFLDVLNKADMNTPDGAPVAWSLRAMGFPSQQRISGQELMHLYLAEAERCGQSVFFYGSTEATLERLRAALLELFPKLKIAGMVSPPFRSLSAEEDQAYVQQINASGASLVFVGLGCPKQEQWMADHRGRIQAVMVGVGAAFDYSAGTLKRAPLWMRSAGLEWLHRLLSEPRRLAKRYFVTNTVFVVKTFKAMVLGVRS